MCSSDLGKRLVQLRHTLRYLIGYLFYNDGIQTVIGLAAVFLSQELFSEQQRIAGEDQTFVLQIYLMVQFVAFLGALLFERVAMALGTRKALMISLVLWCGVVLYAYGLMHTPAEAWGLSAMIAVVLGGSQALSRSLFARMIPDRKSHV